MAKILVAFDAIDDGFERLASAHELVRPPKGRDFTMQELLSHITDSDVLCSVFDFPINADTMRNAHKLRLVANYAVGYNNIDLEYAKQHGIAVTNTPKSVIIPTAELAMGLLLDSSRRITELDHMMRNLNPYKQISRNAMLGLDLYGKTIGIIGYGNIGAAVAERCRAFGMHILYHKRHRLNNQTEQKRGLSYVESIEELIKQSDIISLHTPYSKETHHLINKERLALMKPDTILINTARGAVIDEDALVEFLKNKCIYAAALDVFEQGDIPDQRLFHLDNVVMTPHVGTQTYDARKNMVNELVDNVLGFLEGRADISRIV